MIKSSFEKIAYKEFNNKVFLSIREGSLSDDFLKSNDYLISLQFLLFIILILEPLSYQEIKELVLKVYNIFVFNKVKNADLDNDINDIWDKYRETFLENFKSQVGEIIKSGYLEYELQKTALIKADNLTIPLNPSTFTGMYEAFDPVGFPKCYEEYVLAMRKVERDFHDLHYPKPDLKEIKYKSLTRARAFFIFEMYRKGKISKDVIESKKRIIELVETEFIKQQSGKTIYEALKTKRKENIFNFFESQKIDHSLDYEYGLKLYKEKFPD